MNPTRTTFRLAALLGPLLMVPAAAGVPWMHTVNAVVFGIAVAVSSFALLQPKRAKEVRP